MINMNFNLIPHDPDAYKIYADFQEEQGFLLTNAIRNKILPLEREKGNGEGCRYIDIFKEGFGNGKGEGSGYGNGYGNGSGFDLDLNPNDWWDWEIEQSIAGNGKGLGSGTGNGWGYGDACGSRYVCIYL